ncbi:hypothetical protein PHYBOEH_000484 [Phytophthora boehmeriae]|uniref:PDZ domain-containing protein n=1 Tax=Phytophthora boehmeriae TaxID=109152 RepID=A0A8T1WZF8_9STRA|nr:hypothetical protein PHYBOEH_000484 [Phytophthora boehmeriae]
MERSVASAPPQDDQTASRPPVSPLSLASPRSLPSPSLPPIPFSAIRSSSDGPETTTPSSIHNGIHSIHSTKDEMLSENDLIARGRVLLQAYQTQKRQWLASQNSGFLDSGNVLNSENVPDSLNSGVNIFQPGSDDSYASPTQQGHSMNDAPSLDTKLPPPPPPPLSPPPSTFSTFSIDPTPASELKIHEPSVGPKNSEKSWTEFMQLLKTNGRMMDVVDQQLGEIWGELVAADEQARGPQTSVDKLSEAVTQLLQQKREAEVAIAKLAEVLGSRVFLTGKMADDAVQFVSNQLKLELDASRNLVEKIKTEQASYKKEVGAERTVNGKSAEIQKLLRQQLQDKDKQLQASQDTVAKLKAQLVEQQEAADKKQTVLENALDVKLREVEALCSHIGLPSTYERTKTAEGVTCFRRTTENGDSQLEDPRVPIAIDQRGPSVSAGPTSGYDGIQTSSVITCTDSAQRPRNISTLARDYAAPDNVMRRSFSTPHISHDSSMFEDIRVPPDDGYKHTIEDFSTPLPAGWEMRVTTSGAVFFFNKYTATTTWTDPRLIGTTPAPSSTVNDSSVQSESKLQVLNSSATAVDSRRSRVNSAATDADSSKPTETMEENGIRYVDVVFHERGPIGIHFQANVPDAGATVRSVLPDMAAASKNVLEPYDELVAVNKNAVDSAPFRHIMLLLQGGLRPLTLTFKRDLKRQSQYIHPAAAAPFIDDHVSSIGGSESSDAHLDEEVVVDEGMVVDLDDLRVPTEPAQSQSQSDREGDDEEGMNMADVIITNIFSLFWKPPETTGEVHTV